jgi:flagellar protein FlaI
MFRLEEVVQRTERFKDIRKVNISYYLFKPFAKAHIYYDKERREIRYDLIEPKLDKRLEEIIQKIFNGLLQLIDLSPKDIESKEKLIEFLEDKVKKLLKEYGYEVSEKEYEVIMYYIYRDFVGLNEIEALMHDDYVEDINCNGVDINIYVKHRLFGNLETNVKFTDSNKLKNFIIKLAQRCGKYITYTNPFLEGSLEDGSRVQGTISEEISPRGPNFSIRKFRRIPFSPIELIYLKSVSSEGLAYLWYLIENQASILIIGGAGAGKTTFLNTLATFIPPRAKIVSIEDTREIRLYHDNWIATVSRESVGGLNIGEVDLYKLLRESFRENPDYVIVGEVRGKETYVMFQGIASGHPTLSTFHSENLISVISRLKTPPINLPTSLIELLDVVVTLTKIERGNKVIRKVLRIEELLGIDPRTGRINTNPILAWEGGEDIFNYNSESRFIEKLSLSQGIKIEEIKKEISRRKKFLDGLVKKKVFDIELVQKEIENYYNKL